MLLVAVTPWPVYAVALGLVALWLSGLWRRKRSAAGQMFVPLFFCATLQIAAASLSMLLTANNPIAMEACLLGAAGMAFNAALLTVGLVLFLLIWFAARHRFETIGGPTVVIAQMSVSCLAMLVHARSALLCTV